MDKSKLERLCENAGLKPERRTTLRGHDIFIAEGYVLMPEVTFPMSVKPGEYPGGCYAALFWTAKGEDRMQMGHTLFFDLNHDSQYDTATRRRARINAAIKRADEVLRIREDEHARKPETAL